LVVGLKRALKAAKDMQKNSIEKNKRLFDGHQKEEEFKPGDLVMLYYPNKLLNKLAKRCTGPFKIMEKTSPVNYKICDLQMKQEMIVHVQRIKKYLG
jgi:hypothetical protein